MVLVGVAVRAPLKTTSANNKFCLPKKLASPDGETEPKNGLVDAKSLALFFIRKKIYILGVLLFSTAKQTGVD